MVYFSGGYDFEYLGEPEKTKKSRNPKNSKWATLEEEGKHEEAQKYFHEAQLLFPQTGAIEQELIGFSHLRFVATKLAALSFDANTYGTLLPDGTVSYD